MIDRWTLVHFLFWFVIGANYVWLKVPLPWAIGGTVAGAYAWEVVELLLERRGWVSGNEPARNRWISDPAVSLLGAACGALWRAG